MPVHRGPAASRVNENASAAQANHAAPSNQQPLVPISSRDAHTCTIERACPFCLAWAMRNTITEHVRSALQLLQLLELWDDLTEAGHAELQFGIERSLLAIVHLETQAATMAGAVSHPLTASSVPLDLSHDERDLGLESQLERGDVAGTMATDATEQRTQPARETQERKAVNQNGRDVPKTVSAEFLGDDESSGERSEEDHAANHAANGVVAHDRRGLSVQPADHIENDRLVVHAASSQESGIDAFLRVAQQEG